MLPTFAGFEKIDLLPPELPEPIQAEITFIGGALDGTKHQATVKRELSSGVTLTIKGEVYRYSGDNTFTYERTEEDANQKESN